MDGLELEVRLSNYGVRLSEAKAVDQEDQYFAHPCRDFAQTDEALRIRTEGGRSFVTYKGPKIDTTTKTRHELELSLDSKVVDGRQFSEMLRVLGFTPVAVVQKTRRRFQIHFAGRDVDGSYDIVGGLGAFIELELRANETDLDEAKRVVADLARILDLGPCTSRSYLEMLLEPKYPRRKN
jgi:adenylate cyclase class 2